MPNKLLRRAVMVAGATTLIAASPAAADSVLFTRDNDIYLATPDGSREFRVTSTGDYGTASQADDGTIIATAGREEHLRKLDRFGNVLADFATPISDGPTPTAQGATNYFEGPFDPVISPDGTKVAYQYYWQHYTNNPGGCGGDPGCMGERLESGTAITDSTKLTPWDTYGNLTGWGEPSWWGNDHLVRSNAGVPLAENIVVNRIAPGLGSTDLTRWVNDSASDERRYATLSRDGSKLVAADEIWDGVDGSFRTINGLRFYDTSGGLGAKPTACFRVNYTQDAETTGRSSWSPDGSKLVFEKAQGIEIMDVGSLAGCAEGAGAPAGTTEPRTFIANGHNPSWGPSDVPTSRPVAGAKGARKLRAAVKKGKLARTLRRGLTVRYVAPAAGRVTVVARSGKEVVARGIGRAKAAGKAKARIPFSLSGKRALRGKKAAKLRVALAFQPTAGGPVRQTVKVTLKRR